MAKWTNQQPQTATEEHLRLRWLGGRDGKYFRCCMCGYKFKLGDYWRWVYTNDMQGAGGNPIVCERCDGPDIRERWKAKCTAFYSEANWFFNRREESL